MRLSNISPGFLWQSCGEPAAAWFLVWMPCLLVAMDGEATVSSAMVRLFAILLVAAAIWARGLGPTDALSERVFVAGWACSWAAALGSVIIAGELTSATGWLGLPTLLVGAGWLGWAYHQRQELHDASPEPRSFPATPRNPVTLTTLSMAWLLVVLFFTLMAASRNAHWADAFALAIGLICFTAFQHDRVGVEEPNA